MTNLSNEELKTLNNLSRVQNASVSLGNIVQSIIDDLPGTVGSPVNADVATATLSVTGVVKHGETVSIDNPQKTGSDVYVFMADDAQTPDVGIAVDIQTSTTASSSSLTIDTQPTAGDKMTIGEKVYTFVPVGTDTADAEVSIGTDLDSAQAAIVAAINGTDNINEPHPLVSASAFDPLTDTCVITALNGGTAGDAIATTETFTAVTNLFTGATLANGSDCSAANAIVALVSAITASDTQGVGATDGTGDTVVLTADTYGAAGNNITIGTTMVNGAFSDAATKLAGGVNGTIGKAGETKTDDTYLYIAVDDNTIADSNWRRITLGQAY